MKTQSPKRNNGEANLRAQHTTLSESTDLPNVLEEKENHG